MKKRISFIVIFIFSLHVYGAEFILSSSYLQKQTSTKSKAILKDYESFMNKAFFKPLHVKLKMVNSYINSIIPRYDHPLKANVDIWNTRGEFLSSGGGDCEEYAISKYYTLKDLEVKKDMCLLIVKEKYTGNKHMVLALWMDKNKEPLILDNLSFKILPLSQRVDLEAEFCMNEEGYYKLHNNNTKLKRVQNIHFRAYQKMLLRQKEENIWQK